MDYSLLVGIHNGVKGNQEHLRRLTLSALGPSDESALKRGFLSVLSRSRSLGKLDNFALTGDFSNAPPAERSYSIFYEDAGGF
jgi:hypothetical protein